MAPDAPGQISTRFIDVGGVRVAMRSFGAGPPLVLLKRFRGTMDNWDPALVTSLASERCVFVFDSVGVGESAGRVPPTVEAMADFAIAVMAALELESSDVLGWSIGGFVGQVLAVKQSHLVRRLVLAATTAAAGTPEVVWSPEWLKTASHPQPSVELAMSLFYTQTQSSRTAGAASFARMPYPPASFVSAAAMVAQSQAIARFANDDDGWYARLRDIKAPTLVASGDQDGLFPAVGSAVLAREIQGSQLAIYPDSGHGFLFQYANRVSEDVLRFLKDA
jgi:pimeloyl-ACP methyl ester carboxylesterase